jgi:hypothetical protein
MKLQTRLRARSVRSVLMVLGTASCLAAGTPSGAETEQVPLFRVTVPAGDHSMIEIHPTRAWIKGELAAEIRRADGSPIGDVEVRLVPVRVPSEPVLSASVGELTLEELRADRRIVEEAQRALVATTDPTGAAVFAPQRSGWYSLQLDWSKTPADRKVKLVVSFRQVKRAVALLPVLPASGW